MSDSGQRIEFVTGVTSMPPPRTAEATPTVAYASNGHLLLVADRDVALALLSRIDMPRITVVSPGPDATGIERQLTDTGVACFSCVSVALDGYLGAFSAQVGSPDREAKLADLANAESGHFDLVLDLSPVPLIARRLAPFGYYAPADDTALDAALQAMTESIGEFEKPRYFDYRANLCAHSRSGLPGCTNCLEVCVTGAISPAGDGVSVDPYLCQGCGSCATVCPSGAMTYAFPKPADAIAESRRLITAGGARVLLLHSESEQDEVDALPEAPGLLALVVEEVAAYGMDYWASMVCSGIHRILLLAGDDRDDPNRQALEQQSRLFHTLLQGLGVAEPVVVLLDRQAFAQLAGPGATHYLQENPALAGLAPKQFVTHNEKRQTVRSAFDVLREQLRPAVSGQGAEPVPVVQALPAAAAFGRIKVDTDACTLCMGCVSTCPAGALLDGRDTPALRMIEANCLQCGLCAGACPEEAISLEPRYLYDSLAARKSVTLNQTEPFHCVGCHKPFATRAIIDKMTEKLADHWMFNDAKSLRRLRMCEDCRVRDIFADGESAIDVHGGRS